MANILSENLKALWNAWKRLAHKIGNFQARVILTIITPLRFFPLAWLCACFPIPCASSVVRRIGLSIPPKSTTSIGPTGNS